MSWKKASTFFRRLRSCTWRRLSLERPTVPFSVPQILVIIAEALVLVHQERSQAELCLWSSAKNESWSRLRRSLYHRSHGENRGGKSVCASGSHLRTNVGVCGGDPVPQASEHTVEAIQPTPQDHLS